MANVPAMHIQAVGQIIESWFWDTKHNLADRPRGFQCCQTFLERAGHAVPTATPCAPNAHDAVSARLRPLAINDRKPWKPARAPRHSAYPLLNLRAIGPLALPIHEAVNKWAFVQGYLQIVKPRGTPRDAPWIPRLMVTSATLYDTEQAARSHLLAGMLAIHSHLDGQKEPTRTQSINLSIVGPLEAGRNGVH